MFSGNSAVGRQMTAQGQRRASEWDMAIFLQLRPVVSFQSFRKAVRDRKVAGLTCLLAISSGFGGLLPETAHAQTPVAAVAGSLQSCDMMAQMDLAGLAGGKAPTKVLWAKTIGASSLDDDDAERLYRESRVLSAPADKPDIPAHCLLKGYVNPNIQFELRLPEQEKWNGKFLYVACNGFCGRVDKFAVLAGLQRNYATMTTDGGHHGGASFDGLWALNNMQARVDFGYRATHLAALSAKAMIEIYYQKGPKYSYISGCSKGGQAGVMEAQRYPNDFDGVIARGPTIDYTGVNILHCGKNARAVYNGDGSLNIDVSKHELIKNAVMAYCDPKDGLKDGLISDPRKCDFDPAMLSCKAGQSGNSCLTARQVRALRKIYSPVRNKAGGVIYPGTSLGSEAGWKTWILPVNEDHKVLAWRAASGYLRQIAFEQAPSSDFDWYNFDAEANQDELIAVSHLMDVDSPDFSAFRDAGGKMIVLHGWSDEAIPATASVRWYDGVSAFMGGRDKVSEFARLFLLPGVQHCGSDGVGPSTFDALAALENWVEKGIAPDQIITTKEGKAQDAGRQRPVFPYPFEAKYTGRGSLKKAQNFVAFDPRAAD